MKSAHRQDVAIAELRAVVLDAFGDIERPPTMSMVHPMVPLFAASGRLNPAARLLEPILGQPRWQDLHLSAFDWEDELIQGPDGAAQLVRSAFDLLSSSGVSYYTPSLMLMASAVGSAGEPLFLWLLDRLDPDQVGLDEVEAAFGHWDKAKISAISRFLDWAYSEFFVHSCDAQAYSGQAESVRTFWQDRLMRAASNPTAI